jgi:O-acetylhomoserine/O-acetylserine sulfhydrylase
LTKEYLFHSLGDSKTLVVHPWTTTHQQLTDAERIDAAVDEDHMRISVGIEHIEDLKDDFRYAFESMKEATKTVARLNQHTSHIEQQKRMVQSLFGSRDANAVSMLE